ncbi:unnamed protein product [Kuraishia capsulata CBS 1993]|uniref:Topoisomerase I damage affected protein 2 n=1 Tax=Kuraishia capsulata CBS 1993 TaxID=1382522 RepID=W6MRY2_9ASCO|nr:uncharacterized protein KUCA_T00000551001 [Kuraishia capsulata CBS 1993]CDK24585.1 unnamed protein product [Kuraishia capsulata CBS 1993]
MDVSSSQSEISKQIQKVINDLLLKLSAKSSQYKYVVNVSLVSGSAKDCMGFMGSSWDSSKDGTSTFQIEFGEKTLVVTVIWIYSS